MGRRSRRSVLTGTSALVSGTLGGCSLPSVSGSDPYTPSAVVIENRSADRHTVAVVATDGPTTPRTTVGIEPAYVSGDEEALTVVAGFFTEPGRYAIEARTNADTFARQEGIRLRRSPEGGLDGEVPLIVIDADGSLSIEVSEDGTPPATDR